MASLIGRSVGPLTGGLTTNLGSSCVLGCIGEWLITDLAIGVSVEKAIGTLYKFVLQCFPYSTRTAAACYDARLHLLLYTLPLPVVEPEHKIFRRL